MNGPTRSTGAHSRRLRRLTAVAGLVAATLSTSGSPVGATPASVASPTSLGPTGTAGRTTTVTLLTGDKVSVAVGPKATRVLRIVPGPGRAGMEFSHMAADGHDYVFPADAMSGLARGRLDRRLFDVAALVDQNYDDGHRADLPLLVSTDRKPTLKGIAGARPTRNLPGLGLAALAVDKGQAGRLWKYLRDHGDRVWLNSRIRARLDHSVAQIGAPTAYRAGLTGAGVKVAVLDSGYDAGHPDLRGVVVGARDFTGEGTVRDGIGHGTHVSSIVAGSGAASGGRYRGVAPGAKLVEGRVFNDSGEGQEDWILAGMQWAVEQGATVVNMSLGGMPSDGTDPLEEAVNRLTAEHGTLFVVAAGNEGDDHTVESPGAADAALTVASVTHDDQLSYFSSRGPRVGDEALKPDIAAPGSEITAARAAGTLSDVAASDRYAVLSGTSMATPHVAGAAAILAQQHPNWRAEQLKAALMSSAAPIAGTDVYGQGSGRLDVARAVTQQVWATPASLSFGSVSTTDKPASRTVTYHNDSDRPITLGVQIDPVDERGKPAPAGLFDTDVKAVTVPAHDTATITMTVQPGKVAPGRRYGGALVARAGGGSGTTTRTTFGASVTRPVHDVTVSAVNRAGQTSPVGWFFVQDESTGKVYDMPSSEFGPMALQLPEGDYRIFGDVFDGTIVGDIIRVSSITAIVRRVQVRADTEVELDARPGKPVTVTLDDRSVRMVEGNFGVLSVVVRHGALVEVTATHPMYSVSSPEVTGLSMYVVSGWQQPRMTATVLGPEPLELRADEGNVGGFAGEVTGTVVDAGEGRPEDLAGLDLHGRIALLTVPFRVDDPFDLGSQRVAAVVSAGAAGVLASEIDPTDNVPVPVALVRGNDAEGVRARLAQGPVTMRLRGMAASADSYHLIHSVTGHLPDGADWSVRAADLATVHATVHDPWAGDGPGLLFANQSTLVDWADVSVSLAVRPSQQITEHFTPGRVWFGIQNYEPGPLPLMGAQFGPVRLYQAGEVVEEHRLRAPFGPTLDQPGLFDSQDGSAVPWVYRSGDKLGVIVPSFSDSGPKHTSLDDPTDTGEVTLTRDGRRVGHSDAPGSALLDLAPDPAAYRLTVAAHRNAEDWPLSTSVTGEWTFRSAHASGGRNPLPLLDLRYDMPLDAADAAPAGRAFEFSVDVARQAGTTGPPARTVQVSVSYDGGRRWLAAKVSPEGGRWHVIAPAGGAPGGMVSLRASAADPTGATVTETIINAYRLAGRAG